VKKERIILNFPYNTILKDHVKSMKGSRFEPESKSWSVDYCNRNIFQLGFLSGNNPYQRYDLPISESNSDRPVKEHQKTMIGHFLTRRHCILAGEMGIGKTLAAIETIEKSGYDDWFWIGPKSALRGVSLELRLWKAKVKPRMLTYDELKKVLANWNPSDKPPHGVVFDESALTKTPTSQRSQAAYFLAENMRMEYKDQCFILLMTGTPAPKSPADWWMQCEIACPGFLKEGDIFKFRNSLSMIKMEESITGGKFPKIITWKDSTNKCNVCGQFKEAAIHQNEYIVIGTGHDFEPMENEVERLYKRMNGLVLVMFKKDCSDLPDKNYRIINLKPAKETLRYANIITMTAPRTVTALALLRELSDGFQYKVEEMGEQPCSVCNGLKVLANSLCDGCAGFGTVPILNRTAIRVKTPKDEILKEILDEHSEIGRLVVYAGFTESITKICEICVAEGWHFIRVDGQKRNWQTSLETKNEEEMLYTFQHPTEQYPKIVYVSHPGSGSMGVTLTASPTILYYSNDFNGMYRTQSEDRIHRIGMDVNRGATIIDLIHLPSDKLVLENLKNKRSLEMMSMGQLKEGIQAAMEDNTNGRSEY
jgi:SNF2 family DNA or RNA helicase